MPYVTRDADGKIIRATIRMIPGLEALPHGHPDLVAFLNERGQSPAKVDEALADLRKTDGDMARAIEDVVMALMKKNLLKMTDLPKPVQERMSTRVRLRAQVQDAYDQASGQTPTGSNSTLATDTYF